LKRKIQPEVEVTSYKLQAPSLKQQALEKFNL
jgi:hypothetical protein